MKSISLTNNDKCVYIDDCDFERVSRLNWSYESGYARATTVPRIKMHRFILNPRHGQLVDHINGDGLDNRRDNLRIANISQNQWNRKINSNNKTGYKGVTLGKKNKRYSAAIRFNGENIKLGLFDTAIEAHHAYVEASNKYFGEYSYYHNRESEIVKDESANDIWRQAKLNFWISPHSTSYLVVQRTLLQSMPPEWQEKFIAMLQEMDSHFGHKSNGTFRVFKMGKGANIEDPLADHNAGKRIVTKDDLE